MNEHNHTDNRELDCATCPQMPERNALREMIRETNETVKQLKLVMLGDEKMDVRGHSERIRTLEQKVSRMDKWQRAVIAGSAVVWFIVCLVGYVFYDWCKEHIKTVFAYLQHHQ